MKALIDNMQHILYNTWSMKATITGYAGAMPKSHKINLHGALLDPSSNAFV